MRIKDIQVRLRERELSSGRIELLFDYSFNGKRTRRTTGLFLEKGKTRSVKAHNEEVMLIATEKRKILEDQLNGRNQQSEYSYFTSFFDYFAKQMEKRSSKTTHDCWRCVLNAIIQYERNKSVTIGEITPDWIDGFISFLRKKGLEENSIVTYITKITACLNAAVRDEIIRINPANKVSKPKMQDVDKTFLTQEELKQLVASPLKTPTSNMRAFLFACMTGLRYSDVKRLKWKNVVDIGNNKVALSFRQKKTGGQELFPINDAALQQMGERKGNDFLVFERLSSCPNLGNFLRRWAKQAGINKDFTFHSSRHTFATLLLSKTHDLYLVSNMLGHKKIETTKVYAKLIYEDKQDAVGQLDNIL